MNEKMLKTLIDAAAIKKARIIANGSRFHIEVDAPGRSFTVETGKGALRTWSSIDALRSGCADSALVTSCSNSRIGRRGRNRSW